MKVPKDYRSKLKVARKFLEEKIEDHPRGRCVESTRFLNLVFGFEELAGHYVPPRKHGHKSLVERWHAWGFDPANKIYVDLSMDQFYGNYGGVTILPEENPFLIPNEKSTITQRNFSNEDISRGGIQIEDLVKEFKNLNGA